MINASDDNVQLYKSFLYELIRSGRSDNEIADITHELDSELEKLAWTLLLAHANETQEEILKNR